MESEEIHKSSSMSRKINLKIKKVINNNLTNRAEILKVKLQYSEKCLVNFQFAERAHNARFNISLVISQPCWRAI